VPCQTWQRLVKDWHLKFTSREGLQSRNKPRRPSNTSGSGGRSTSQVDFLFSLLVRLSTRSKVLKNVCTSKKSALLAIVS